MPVQVKGCKKNNTKRKSIKYSIDISDLRNFLKEGGTIFFVVYFDNNGDNANIYYRVFLPYDLISILNSNENSKTCSLKFRPFPNDASAITDILMNFSKHKEMQAAIKSQAQLLSLKDLSHKEMISEITIPLTSSKPIDDPISYLFKHDAYVYATTPFGFHIPVDHFERISLAQSTREIRISVGDAVFYEIVEIVYEEKCMRYLIGKSFTMTLFENERKMNFNFKLKGTLSERIADSTFMMAVINNGGFCVNSTFVPFLYDKLKGFDKETFQRRIDELIEVSKALKSLDVTEELNMDVMDDTDYRMLNKILNSNEGCEVSLNNTEQPFGFVKVGNLNILISVKKNSETGLYRFVNFYDSMFRMFIQDSSENMHMLPLFMGLRKEDIVKCSNFNLLRVLKEFSEIRYDNTVSESVTLWLLELIKAYDLSKKKYLLNAAKEMIKLIKQNDKFIDNTTIRLNELQIIKRERTLNFTEKADLYNTVASFSGNNLEIKIGAYILLDEIEEAQKLLNILPKERKKQFIEYPIYTMMKQGEVETSTKAITTSG